MARKSSPGKDSKPVATLGAGDGHAFTAFADLLLQREALFTRLARGGPPDELAGLRLSDARIDQLLLEITASSDEIDTDLTKIRTDLEPMVDQQRELFRASLSERTAFSYVAANAGLDVESAEVLALLAAIELDSRRQQLVAYMQDDITRRRLSLGAIRRLFGSSHSGALAVAYDSPLVRACLVTVDPAGPWANREVAVAPVVMWALIGDSSSDPELSPDATVRSFDVESEGHPLVFVVGEDRSRRVKAAAVATAGDHFLVSPPPANETEWQALIREATLQGIGVIIDAPGDVEPNTRQWIERAPHLAWAVVTQLEMPLEAMPLRPWVEIEASDDAPSDAEWKAALGDAGRTHALTARQLELVELAYEPKGRDLDAAVRRLASGKIDRLTRRVRPERTWDDIVLAPERLEQLHELVDRYRHRSLVYEDWGFRADKSSGVIALFHGPSGTGKTLASEIIAGDLGLDLFKLDLSAVVSKYIGETEKNLEQVFSAAEAASGVLLFDEADSLFGKRGEVQDARDRYANQEVSYLLQRVEAYSGIVILTTNFQKNIDAAFLRRIHVSLEFPMPEPDQRLALWQGGFPPNAPLDGVDHEFLAKQFKLAGGSIHNVTVYAAFLAAAADSKITMELVIQALKREYQKLGRLRTKEEFGPYTDLVID